MNAIDEKRFRELAERVEALEKHGHALGYVGLTPVISEGPVLAPNFEPVPEQPEYHATPINTPGEEATDGNNNRDGRDTASD